jgi:hypothetical protein
MSMKQGQILFAVGLWVGVQGLVPVMAATKPSMTVYRSPTCGCCEKWVAHMRQNGFKVEDIVSSDMEAVKQQRGVPKVLRSCHTAVVGQHVIEGHVPAQDIEALLKGPASPYGISVPGMPSGTPGMEMGGRKDPYDVVGFEKNGSSKVLRHVAE